MNFIKKINEKNFDDSVHLQFMKFSKGEFRDRAVIKAKVSKGKYTINTTAEFANELVRDVAEKVGEKSVNVKGIIVSTSNLREMLDYKKVSQFQGVKKYEIDKEMTGNEVLNLLNELPKAFFALSFKTPDNETELKVKAKLPKTGKPKTKDGGEMPKPDFCKLVTTDANIGKGFVFERPEFQTAEINHDFFVEEIVISDELKKEKDFAKMREEAKRKGKIVRKANIDGKEVVSELDFEA